MTRKEALKKITPEVLNQETEEAIEKAVTEADGNLSGIATQLTGKGVELASRVAQKIKKNKESP